MSYNPDLSTIKWYDCPYCDETFPKPESCSRHISRLHNEQNISLTNMALIAGVSRTQLCETVKILRKME